LLRHRHLAGGREADRGGDGHAGGEEVAAVHGRFFRVVGVVVGVVGRVRDEPEPVCWDV
jgi:hypothetical protein